MASQRARRLCDSSGANSGVTSSLLRGQLLFRIAKNDYRRAGFWATANPGRPARVVFERWRSNRRLSDHFRFFEFRCFRALSNISPIMFFTLIGRHEPLPFAPGARPIRRIEFDSESLPDAYPPWKPILGRAGGQYRARRDSARPRAGDPLKYPRRGFQNR
jgi:hypothetical protein